MVPDGTFKTFLTGDCDDKCIMWRIEDEKVEQEEIKQEQEETKEGVPPVVKQAKYKTTKLQELEGHKETVEIIKFNSDKKLVATAGMNNFIRIWDVPSGFTLKTTIEDASSEDINFLEWHPKGNVILVGGKDNMIWMFDGVKGTFLACMAGH